MRLASSNPTSNRLPGVLKLHNRSCDFFECSAAVSVQRCSRAAHSYSGGKKDKASGRQEVKAAETLSG